MDMVHGALIVALIMCSQVAIGHRSSSRDIKHWREWERNSADLDAPIKGSGWGIKPPMEIDSNEYYSFEPDSSEHDSWEQGSYQGGHHGGYRGHHGGHHGHHGRYPDWETKDRATAKPKRRPTSKPLHKNTPALTFKSTPTSKFWLAPVLSEMTDPRATSDSPRRTITKTEKTIGNSTSIPDLSLWFTNGFTRSTSATPDSATPTLLLDIQNCMRNCPVTPEFNPVCGTNNVTYDNPGRLVCAKICGVDVEFWKQSSCTDKDVTVSPNIAQCIRNCYMPTNFDPVCGTDDVTYDNSEHLFCAQFCGLDVKLKKTVACSSDGDRTIPLPTAIQLCVNNCPTLSINSPVCGSNGVTYKNSMQLNCHRICRVDVQMVPCTNTNNNGVGNENSNNSSSPNNSSSEFTVKDCIALCPQTPEYNPVCGTNNVTYRNPGHLGCAQMCGVTVELKRKSACAPAIATESPDEINAVSNSENKDENGETVTEQDSFTIPPDVLNIIFNYSTTTESDDFDIDPRFHD